MKTITKITRQQNGERYNLFLDEVFFQGVCEDTLIKLSLKKGMQVDEAALEEILAEESKNRCLSYAIYLLGRQNYFEKALVMKLKQKEYTDGDIEFALEKLKTYRYLNDGQLAEAFVRDKKRFAKKGPRYIAQALRIKGVDGDTITKIMEAHYNADEQLENCKAVALKKVDYYRRKTQDDYTFKGKMYAYLAGRGFDSELIRKVIEQIMTEEV